MRGIFVFVKIYNITKKKINSNYLYFSIQNFKCSLYKSLKSVEHRITQKHISHHNLYLPQLSIDSYRKNY